MMHIGWQEVRFYYTVDMHVAHLYVVDGGGAPLIRGNSRLDIRSGGVTNNRITREREVDDTEI